MSFSPHLLDLPNELLVEITQSLSLNDIKQLLSINEYQSKLSDLFRYVTITSTESTFERFFDYTDCIQELHLSEEDLNVDSAVIYLIEIHSWENFDFELFQDKFLETKNFIIVHQYDKIDSISLTNQICKETVSTVLSSFHKSTIVINEEDSTFLSYEGLIDPNRLIFARDVNLISMLSTDALSEGIIQLPNVKDINLGCVPQAMIQCFDYQHVTNDLRISLTENEIDYESYDSDLLGDMDPYHFRNVKLSRAKIATLEGFHEINGLRSDVLVELRGLIQESHDDSGKMFGLYNINTPSLRVMQLNLFSSEKPPSLRDLKMPNLKYLQVCGNYVLSDDNYWDPVSKLSLPQLEALDVKDHPDVLNLLTKDTICNLKVLQISCFSSEDVQLLESQNFPNLERLDYRSFDANGTLVYPRINAPKLTSFSLNGISGGNSKSLEGLSLQCPQLKVIKFDLLHLDVGFLNMWDDEFPNLEYLVLLGSSFYKVFSSISRIHLPKLKQFTLNFKADDEFLEWDFKLNAPQLRSLLITKSPSVVNEGHSSRINSTAYFHLKIQGFQELKKFEYQSQVSELFVTDCPKLEMIKCNYSCAKLEKLTCKNLPKLGYLDLNSLNKDNYDEIEHFENVNSEIKRNFIDIAGSVSRINAVQREFDYIADQFDYKELVEWDEILESFV